MALDWSSWMGVASIHLRGARNALDSEDYLVVVQLSHQIAEEALKALWIVRTAELAPRTHDLMELSRGLEAPDDVTKHCRYLTPLYTASRYPDASNSNPIDLFDRAGAVEALEAAESVHSWCLARVEHWQESTDGA
jgi:HEPN domain-containing protein